MQASQIFTGVFWKFWSLSNVTAKFFNFLTRWLSNNRWWKFNIFYLRCHKVYLPSLGVCIFLDLINSSDGSWCQQLLGLFPATCVLETLSWWTCYLGRLHSWVFWHREGHYLLEQHRLVRRSFLGCLLSPQLQSWHPRCRTCYSSILKMRGLYRCLENWSTIGRHINSHRTASEP